MTLQVAVETLVVSPTKSVPPGRLRPVALQSPVFGARRQRLSQWVTGGGGKWGHSSYDPLILGPIYSSFWGCSAIRGSLILCSSCVPGVWHGFQSIASELALRLCLLQAVLWEVICMMWAADLMVMGSVPHLLGCSVSLWAQSYGGSTPASNLAP